LKFKYYKLAAVATIFLEFAWMEIFINLIISLGWDSLEWEKTHLVPTAGY
jgi:hypothetical protein